MKLVIQPTLKQHLCYQALSDPAIREVFFGGGAGGGKTWLICESRIINAYRFPGYKSFIGRNELKRLMQSTFQTFIKVCQHHQIPRMDWRLDGKYNFIEFANGSRIDLLDLKYLPAEDPLFERFGSLEYSDGAIEEAGEIHPLAREVLGSRINRHLNEELGIIPNLLHTGNPKKNWTYQVFYKPWKDGTLPKDMVFIQALYSDNPHTAETYGETLGRIKDRVMRERLRDGIWEYEDDAASLMGFEAINDMFTNTVDEDEAVKRYVTMDVARYGEDKSVITCWEGWHAYKIMYREKQGTDQSSEWLKTVLEQERVPRSRALVDEDGIGGGVVDQVRGVKGFTANASAIDETDRSSDNVEANKAFGNLKTQCAYILADRINARGVKVTTEDLKIKNWLIEDLEQIKEANTDSDDKKRRLTPKEETKLVTGRSPDFGDTFIMRGLFDIAEPSEGPGVHQYRPKVVTPRSAVRIEFEAPSTGVHQRRGFTRRRS